MKVTKQNISFIICSINTNMYQRQIHVYASTLYCWCIIQHAIVIITIANEIVEVGNAESQKIQVIAEADRDANLTMAYVGALSSMYTTLNVVQEDHKLSIMMIRVLEEAAVKGNLYWSYGYENETIYDRPLALPAG